MMTSVSSSAPTLIAVTLAEALGVSDCLIEVVSSIVLASVSVVDGDVVADEEAPGTALPAVVVIGLVVFMLLYAFKLLLFGPSVLVLVDVVRSAVVEVCVREELGIVEVSFESSFIQN